MKPGKPVVLIGPISDDPAESVSAVNRALMAGAAEHYTFIPSNANRRFGTTGQSRLNLWNLYYLARHLATWIWLLIRHRPQIAHYAVSAGMALWKGLLFLRLARLFGARTVGHLHSGGFLTLWKNLQPARRQSALAQLSRLDAFVTLSEQWRHAVASEVGVPRHLLHVVNNPIDARFEDAALQLPVDRRGAAVLAMGVLGQDKGVLDLVEACGQLKQRGLIVKLTLAGPEREAGIRERVQHVIAQHDLGSSIELPGRVHGEGKLQVFRDTTISILPSYYENFPLVLLEAAAAGHAIISTPVGAVPEFFEDGVSALFVEPHNVAQIAAALERLVTSPAERTRLARNARLAFTHRLARPEIIRSLQRTYGAVLTGAGTN